MNDTDQELFRAVGFHGGRREMAATSWQLAQGAPYAERETGYVIKASADEHVKLFIVVGKDKKTPQGMRPYFEGDARLSITLHELTSLPDSPIPGVTWGVVPDEGKGYPLAAAVPDVAAMAMRTKRMEPVEIHLCAFALGVRSYPDVETFMREKPGPGFPAFAAGGWLEVQQARREAGPDEPRPMTTDACFAIFSGSIRVSERLTNRHSGLEYQHLLVDIRSGTADVVARPGAILGDAQPGNVVHGRFLVCATVPDGGEVETTRE